MSTVQTPWMLLPLLLLPALCREVIAMPKINPFGEKAYAFLRTPIREDVRITILGGKQVRAKPISAKYEQGKIHHVGLFPRLEDEMCLWIPGEPSPNRMDAMVWAFSELMLATGMGMYEWMRQQAEAKSAAEQIPNRPPIITFAGPKPDCLR
jgi:hypothetical protein